MHNTIEELENEINRLKAALYDIDQQRSQVQNILQARKGDLQNLQQKARQAEAEAAAVKRAAAEKAAAEKAALDAKTKPTAGNKGDTAQPKA